MDITGVFSVVRAKDDVEDIARLAALPVTVVIVAGALAGLSDTLTNEEVESDRIPEGRGFIGSLAILFLRNQSITFFAALLETFLFSLAAC